MANQGMVSISAGSLDDLTASIAPGVVRSAAISALERTKTSARAEAGRLITSVWNISRGNLERTASGRDRITVSGRVSDDLTAEIQFWAGGISLFYFGAKEYQLTAAQTKQTAKRLGKAYKAGNKQRVGIKVQLLRGGKVAMLRQFFARVRYGKGDGVHVGVFRRVPGRYKTGSAKMIESMSVGIATMVNQPKVLQPLTVFIQDTFAKRMQHELQRRGYA